MRMDRFLFKALHKIYIQTHSDDWDKDVIKDSERTSKLIIELLTSKEPCMICRYGSVELINLTNYLSIVKDKHSALSFITDNEMEWWRNELNVQELKNNAGFFPNDEASMRRFDHLMLEDTKQIDILGSWIKYEKFMEEYIPKSAVKVRLKDLEPFWSSTPWTTALKGKNVLVVHPFASLMEKQYKEKRNLLFPGRDILPEFNLKTIKAVQSLGGDSNGFKDWFEALEYMKNEIDKVDYDICIIGCGAYGFPLAAHVKRSGKKAFHLGGATQLLFGMRGKRWEDPMYGVKEWGIPVGGYYGLMNENWIRPGDALKSKNADKVENGCYW